VVLVLVVWVVLVLVVWVVLVLVVWVVLVLVRDHLEFIPWGLVPIKWAVVGIASTIDTVLLDLDLDFVPEMVHSLTNPGTATDMVETRIAEGAATLIGTTKVVREVATIGAEVDPCPSHPKVEAVVGITTNQEDLVGTAMPGLIAKSEAEVVVLVREVAKRKARSVAVHQACRVVGGASAIMNITWRCSNQ
jgi:hypothetical protein